MIAGFVPFTTIDFPGHLACVIFFQGCPLRCPFCHNPELQRFDGAQNEMLPDGQNLFSFLEKRRGLLDGVVLSGGEPLMQPDCASLIQEIRKKGFLIGIHTSGIYPEILADSLSEINWVGLDIKAPAEKYSLLCGRKNVFSKVERSLDLLLENNISFEARTTCDPRYLTKEDVLKTARFLHQKNVSEYVLQKYRTFPGDRQSPSEKACQSFFEDESFLNELKNLFPRFSWR